MKAQSIGPRLHAVAHRLSTPITFLRNISAPMDDLTILANRFGSDKGDQNLNRHHYTRIYSKLFADYRNKPIRLLEIGLLHYSDPAWRNVTQVLIGKSKAARAPSLQMWAEYFPNGTVFGFDINDFTDVQIDRCKIFRGDMGSREDLDGFAEESGGQFDIIIEDASHASHHQQIALARLFPALRPGGLYVIEDLSWQPAEIEPEGAPKTVDILREAAASGKFMATPFINEFERDYLENNVSRISLFDSLSPHDPVMEADSLAVLYKRE